MFRFSQRSNNIVEVRSRSICTGQDGDGKGSVKDDKLTVSKDMHRRKSKDEMISEMMTLFEEAKVSLSLSLLPMPCLLHSLKS